MLLDDPYVETQSSNPGVRLPVRSQSSQGLICFLHIPKTAGTTLNSILNHQYPPAGILKVMMRGMSLVRPKASILSRPLISPSKLRQLKMALARRDGLHALQGHFDMSLARLLPPGARFVTILRDPVERAVSHYYHYRNLNSDPISPLAQRSTLAQWVSACGLVEMDNGQTRRLAGEMNLPCGQVSQDTLERAKTNLRRFAVVGLTERFEESQVLLHHAFHWPMWRYPARNVSPNRPPLGAISPADLEVVGDCNRFDVKLYQFAAELFENTASRIDMAGRLTALRMAPAYPAS